MNIRYYAHTTKDQTKIDWQSLDVHLRNTSKLCEQYAKEIGLGEEGRIAGLFHDIGKYAERFQARLEDNSITGINHWSSGAQILFFLNHVMESLCVQGHHLGIPNLSDLASLAKQLQINPEYYKNKMGFDESLQSITDKLVAEGIAIPKDIPGGRNYDFSFTMKTRMLFSCLVDADRTDTRNFSWGINGQPDITGGEQKNSLLEYPAFQPEKALQILLDEVAKKKSNTKLGKIRSRVLKECITAGELPSGIYTLTVPTGGSKTLSSIACGLKHAAKFDKRRLIYVIPFTTIIDQTGNVLTEDTDPNKLTLKYNKYFGDDYVLEHHSTLEVDTSKVEKYRISTSNWGNPIVVTTTVQFFESLFSNKASPCVKIHNIPNSVLIFDEVQTLPTKLLKSLLTAVQVLVKEYNCTAIFCSATVPAFESVNLDVPWNPIEICSNTEKMFKSLNRANIIFKSRRVTHMGLAKRMVKHSRCLTVVNTKFDAAEVFKYLISLNTEGCYHLSTNMCAEHRKKIISEIRIQLTNGLPCRVVSTQLIEAGVDVDFPYGFRVFGPLDSIIQTEGRINREGKLKRKGTLEVIKLIDCHTPRGTYQTCINLTNGFLQRNRKINIHSPKTFRKYYKEMYSLVGTNTDDVFVASQNCQFQTASEACRIIPDLTVGVIVPYGKGKEYIDLIQRTHEVPKWLYRKLQMVSVNIYWNQIDKLLFNDIVRYIDCGGSDIYYWNEKYSERVGIVGHIRTPSSFII